MNRVTKVMRMFLRDKFSWVLLPWIIILSSFAVNLVIAAFIEVEGGLHTGGVASIIIYMLVVGIIVVSQTFPFALGLGVRRTDYFLGSMLTATVISVTFAALLIFLGFIEKDVIVGWGVNLHFFHLESVHEGPILESLIMYVILMLWMFVTGFAIASLQRRFGRTGTFTFFIALSLLGTIFGYAATYNGWWAELGNSLGGYTMFEYSLWLLPVTLVCMLASYGLLRRATV
ncbi:hypothetical protein SY83_09510 [Paenibacillus swuensis]|uniref:Uncharacterized protein n=1 Tax=Paenibacillus swuensis TaxID=1178515 RepID=A0A172TI60_9BACL|nr:hypothetical protein [Paenibacillus swuensis]ANE46473.1 hypothetical protein SY83_09510 [Paenibacillus swuensis]